MAIDDSMQARITADCPDSIREILLHAWSHDISELKKLLDAPGKASIQDPTTGETPLHAAIRACGPARDGDDDLKAEEAKETIYELFLKGAIWNDVDSNNETPGCLAQRLGQSELYRTCVEAGVRAELLFGLLDGYEQLSSGSEMDEDEEVEATNGESGAQEEGASEAAVEPTLETEGEKKFVPPTVADPNVTSEEYLQSNLTYSEGKLVDDGGNGVMMAWETEIMRKSVDAVLPQLAAGKRILNVGFGMGIIDAMFAETHPSRHHVIEAHPEVLEHIDKPDSKFGAAWEASGPEEGAYKIHRGRWQDIVPKLLEQGEVYDAIYFDTFGEDYGQLNMFFTEYIPGLMDEQGRFSFFNGLGADRRVCYDVYTKVVEMHMADAGLDVEWDEMDVDMKGLEEAGKGEWEGVKRRYWTLDKYRLPTCTFLG
ncbi:arginine n-methyltransferase 2 [Colletotrichum truncatum]|uniref:Arginine n-methyltransferase 2 n=1 Tax=Colletotrichum truncatum TaxID=5467 RepID=A0ACC3Z4N6_COLTU|nr:arginine n-methyltransferase 2 [Colletotrichum truncatum]KAF6788626.1 arginine n-methyltransferase 2 [Colletotrichum truncatum]